MIARRPSLTLPAGLENGTYVVAWRVTSADSHPVSGAFSFSIGAAALAGHRGRAGRLERGGEGGRRDRPRPCRSSGFALAVGGACVLLLLVAGGRSSARGRQLPAGGLGALMLGTVALLLLQGPYTTGGVAARCVQAVAAVVRAVDATSGRRCWPGSC